MNELLRRYKWLICKLAQSDEDLAQTLRLKFLDMVPRFPGENFSRWIATCLGNERVSWHRKRGHARGRGRETQGAEGWEGEVPGREPDPANIAESNELEQDLRECIDTALTEKERDTLIRRYWKGLAGKEIAEAEGVYPSAITERHNNAIQKLATCLEKKGWHIICESTEGNENTEDNT